MKVLGLSGGADSVYLFHSLLESKEHFRCVYVNHKMNVHDDAAGTFCRELCSAYGVQLKTIDINKDLKNETQAREARYAVFQGEIDVKNDILVLAHHMDDVVETMLMNLCKGSSLNGMSGIRSNGYVNSLPFDRPLIEQRMTRDMIHASLTERGIKWYEDPTNKDTSILRNRVRNQLIPLMEEMFPDCVEKIVDFADDCRFANDVVQEHVRKHVSNRLENQKTVNGTQEQRIWFFDWMRREGVMVSKRHYREYVAFIGNNSYKEMSLPGDKYIAKAISTGYNDDVTCVFCWSRIVKE